MAGIVLSTWLARVIVSLQPADIPRLDSVSPDANVLLFGLGLSALTTLLFGLLPVLQFSQTNVTDSLRKGAREPRRRRLPLTPRNLLLVGEIGLTVMLLVCTGLLVRSFASLRKVDPGFKPKSSAAGGIRKPIAGASGSNTFGGVGCRKQFATDAKHLLAGYAASDRREAVAGRHLK